MSQGSNDGKEMYKIDEARVPSPLSLVLLSSRNSATMVT